ncbi:MAG: N-acetyltransferase family protein, partial [Bdellovibrionota bacterium]
GFASGGARRDGLDYDGEIYAIYLLRDFKNSGLGGILFRESLEALKRRGFSGAGLWVLERNPTRAFYEKMNGCLLPEKKETKIGSKTHTEVAYGWSFS